MSKQVEFVIVGNIELQFMPAGEKSIVMHNNRVIITINTNEKEDFIKDFTGLFERFNVRNSIKKAG